MRLAVVMVADNLAVALVVLAVAVATEMETLDQVVLV
jgi:hypothetical protein